jgi:hypothetical protein
MHRGTVHIQLKNIKENLASTVHEKHGDSMMKTMKNRKIITNMNWRTHEEHDEQMMTWHMNTSGILQYMKTNISQNINNMQ